MRATLPLLGFSSLIMASLTLTGCLLPTPVSLVSSGFDAVSFVASGKSVSDHGISLVTGEDCAMMGLLEGEICRERVTYAEEADQLAVLEPLPNGLEGVDLASAPPTVRASLERSAAYEGWEPEAVVPGGFVAAGFARPEPGAAPAPVTAVAEPQLAAWTPPTPARVDRDRLSARFEQLALAAAADAEAVTAPAEELGGDYLSGDMIAARAVPLPSEAEVRSLLAAMEAAEPAGAQPNFEPGNEVGKRPSTVSYGRLQVSEGVLGSDGLGPRPIAEDEWQALAKSRDA